MKTIIKIIICCMVSLPSVLHGRSTVADSLKIKLNTTGDIKEKVALLLKITDLIDNSQEESYYYALKLAEYARDSRDLFAMYAPMGTIIEYYLSKPGKKESVLSYLKSVEPYFLGTEYEGLLPYYKMTYQARELQLSSKESKKEVCDRIMQDISKVKINETPYEKVARLFLTGVIVYQLTTLTQHPSMVAGLSYWEEGYRILRGFPVLVRRNFAANYVTVMLPAYATLGKKEKVLTLSEDYFAHMDAYFEQEDIVQRRPYVEKTLSYLLCYHSLIFIPDLIGQEKVDEYFNRYRNFMYQCTNRGLLSNSIFFYQICVSYYRNRKQYDQALRYADSLIFMTKQKDNLVVDETALYQNKAEIYALMGNWKEAMRESANMIRINDSLSASGYIKNVEDLIVKIETDKLEMENGLLRKQRQEKMAVFMILLIFLMICVSGIIWMILRKQRKMLHHISEQELKARESVLLKNYFMESIYSDVLSPLNGINRKTELLFLDTVSEEEKRVLAESISDDAERIIERMDSSLKTNDFKQI